MRGKCEGGLEFMDGQISDFIHIIRIGIPNDKVTKIETTFSIQRRVLTLSRCFCYDIRNPVFPCFFVYFVCTHKDSMIFFVILSI